MSNKIQNLFNIQNVLWFCLTRNKFCNQCNFAAVLTLNNTARLIYMYIYTFIQLQPLYTHALQQQNNTTLYPTFGFLFSLFCRNEYVYVYDGYNSSYIYIHTLVHTYIFIIHIIFNVNETSYLFALNCDNFFAASIFFPIWFTILTILSELSSSSTFLCQNCDCF